MDKVLVHKGMTTLDVLAIGLVIVVVFKSVDAEDHARIHIVTEPKRDSTGHQQHIDQGVVELQGKAQPRAAPPG
jgi:ABC-type bacteriocin/lantibiotic exporter with double-glycine peptidase domain